MQDEYELIASPLSRKITRDGVTVGICIYRGVNEDGWLLEVEDQDGGSTVWEDTFTTDQSALDEAMRVIETEGIEVFAADSSISSPSQGDMR
jgi:hypothetical protein